MPAPPPAEVRRRAIDLTRRPVAILDRARVAGAKRNGLQPGFRLVHELTAGDNDVAVASQLLTPEPGCARAGGS